MSQGDNLQDNALYDDMYQNWDQFDNLNLNQQPTQTKKLFSDENPYSEVDAPFQLAIELLDKGQTSNGILALEAHLKKNEQDARAWRILGDLHMECDDDELALKCLKKAHKVDPNDLDTLLGLGVSCANQLEQNKAQNHLKNWLINNQKYSEYISKNEFLSKGDNQNADSSTVMTQIVKVLEEAHAANPHDTDLIMCLAVHHVSTSQFEVALQLFKDAAQLDPENYSFWNKIGAVASFLVQKEECLKVYTEALAIKPNYVRAWVNMGIIHFHTGEYENTVKYFLTALSLRPNLDHVWTYIRLAVVSIGDSELINAVDSRNMEKLRERFPFVSADQLPESKIEYKKLNEKYILKQKIED